MLIEPHDPEEFSPDLPQVLLDAALLDAAPLGAAPLEPSASAPPDLPAARSTSRRVLQILTNFFFGQGAAQGISVLAGLILVRRLSIEAYAQFGLAVGFQTVFSVLMDLGFASTIVPLVGDRHDDRQLVGRYVRSAKHLRDRTFLYLAPVASLAFLASMHQRHWSWGVQLALLASVLVSLYSGGRVAYFSAPLFVYGRLREYYLPQILSGGARLVTYVVLSFTGGLTAWSAAALSALNITLNGTMIGRASRRYFTWPDREDAAVDKEMIAYILPASPAIIFSAFQSQISLFLMGFFGGTVNIAEVTALSRIGQLFAVAMTFNLIVIEPYVARHSRKGLARTFTGLLLLASLACAPLTIVAFLWPQAFIWIIGSKYDGVRPLMGWFILSCCMNFVSGLAWVMNRARKWVFWSGSILEVALLLGVQALFLALVGVRTTRQAVLFGLASSVCYAIAHGYATIYGFIKGSRHQITPAAAAPFL